MGMAREKGKQTNPTARLGYTPPVICKTLSITDLRKLRQTLHWVQVLGRERFAHPTLPWGLLQVRDDSMAAGTCRARKRPAMSLESFNTRRHGVEIRVSGLVGMLVRVAVPQDRST